MEPLSTRAQFTLTLRIECEIWAYKGLGTTAASEHPSPRILLKGRFKMNNESPRRLRRGIISTTQL